MFHDVLVAIDGSPTAERALGEAMDLAGAYRARLTILYVIAPMPPTVARVPVNVEQLRQDAEEEARKVLAAAVERVPGDVSVTSRTRHGHPGEEILSQIDEGRHDLVVLGSRGRGRARSNLLGSVGATVHFGATVAMLVIHPGDSDD